MPRFAVSAGDGARRLERGESDGGLTVSGLSLRYGHVLALRNVSIALPRGESAALIGANGAGKTSLIRAVSGGLRLYGGRIANGRIMFDGYDIAGRDAADVARLGIVHVPEGRAVFTKLTVTENLRVAGLTVRSKRRRRALRSQVDELFPVLADRGTQKAGLLSGGEQQMLAIGRGLMMDPRVLLLDEPSLGLAPAMMDRIADAIRTIMAGDISLLLVEQNATLALELVDKVYVLETGVVAMEGASSEVASSDRVRDLYLGGDGTASTDASFTATLSRWQR